MNGAIFFFFDKSRVSLHPDNRRIFNSRERGTRNNPAFVHKSVRFGGVVFADISIDGRTNLHIIPNGASTGRRYRDEIPRSIEVFYAAEIGDDVMLMENNFRLHRAKLGNDYVLEERIVQMEWPPCSLDINTIEYVWDILGRQVSGRLPPQQTLQELERGLLEELDRNTSPQL